MDWAYFCNLLTKYIPIFFDFLILWGVIYSFFSFFHGTKMPSVLAGIFIILLIFSLGAKQFHLVSLHYILDSYLPPVLGTAFIVVFQPEIRRTASELGKFFGNPAGILRGHRMTNETIQQVTLAAKRMAARRIGALIVFERTVGLAEIRRQSVELDARVDAPILESIFFPNSPLHDCAVIINCHDNRIVAARAVLPLAEEEDFLRNGVVFGTRHRAAIGITQESDAVALVVSEESGHISLAYHGEFERNLDSDELEKRLNSLLARFLQKQKKARSDRAPVAPSSEKEA